MQITKVSMQIYAKYLVKKIMNFQSGGLSRTCLFVHAIAVSLLFHCRVGIILFTLVHTEYDLLVLGPVLQ